MSGRKNTPAKGKRPDFALGCFVESYTGDVLDVTELDGGSMGPVIRIDERGGWGDRPGLWYLTRDDAQKLITFLQGWIATSGPKVEKPDAGFLASLADGANGSKKGEIRHVKGPDVLVGGAE